MFNRLTDTVPSSETAKAAADSVQKTLDVQPPKLFRPITNSAPQQAIALSNEMQREGMSPGQAANQARKATTYMSEGGAVEDEEEEEYEEEAPPGALPEEVADDQPTMLSKGEFVVPANIVRWYGLKFFMDLRDEALRGLADMDAAGQLRKDGDGKNPGEENEVSEMTLMGGKSAYEPALNKGGALMQRTGGVPINDTTRLPSQFPSAYPTMFGGRDTSTNSEE